MSKRHSVRIGVFIPSAQFGCQLLDMASVDVFAMASHQYLGELGDLVPGLSQVAELAPEVHIMYISTLPRGSRITLTAGAVLEVTHNLTDAEVRPGELDIVHVPGPDPREEFGPDVAAWLAAHAEHQGTDILSVCTGIFVCGAAGLLKGRKASGPRGLQDMIRKKFDGVQLVGDEYRWVRDGNFWSSGECANLISSFLSQPENKVGYTVLVFG